MRAASSLRLPSLAAFALLFIACGGSGGGAPTPEAPTTIDIGLQSATVPSSAVHTVRNPLGSTATVTHIPSGGVLDFRASAFPKTVAGGGTFSAPIEFIPTGSGQVTASAALRFTAGGDSRTLAFELSATGEGLQWSYSQNPLNFGPILSDLEKRVTLQITNGSQQSPVLFTSGTTTSTAFRLEGSPFPLSIPAGGTAEVDVSFVPEAVRLYAGSLILGTGDAGGPLSISLSGGGTGAGEQTLDLGEHTFVNNVTPYIFFDVPADAISVNVEAYAGTNDELSLAALEGPGGKIYSAGVQAGPTRWFPAREAFAARIPDGDRDEVQLVSGGGQYAFRIRRSAGSGSTCQARVVLERRENAVTTPGTLDLNVFFAPVAPFTAATAANDVGWQQVVTRMSAILGSVDIELGDIDYYDATDTVTNDPALSQVGQVLAIGGMATEVRATVIVTRSLEGGQLLGFSAALGGPKDIGKQSTGVLAVVANQTTDTLGATIVHELAHYLGIWHTTEGDGSFDRIEDTLECPVFGTSTACPTAGGGQLMHFQVLGGTTITPTQGLIMRSHPLVEPAAPGLSKPRIALPPLSPAALARLRSFYADGCGTCRERDHR